MTESPYLYESVFNAKGEQETLPITVEKPLSLYVNKKRLVTLMTTSEHPLWLCKGYLFNQGLIDDPSQIHAMQYDEETSTVVAKGELNHAPKEHIVTSGCGQGSIHAELLSMEGSKHFESTTLTTSLMQRAIDGMKAHNRIYKTSGAVHGCGLWRDEAVVLFTEDVGRHNALDALSGYLLDHPTIDPLSCLLYTTGRLTSEMVIKSARMGVPVVLSRSGATHMGLTLAKRYHIILIGRIRGSHFVVYHGGERVTFDAPLKKTYASTLHTKP